MLTSLQRELLLQGEKEIDERLTQLRLTEKLVFEAFYRICPTFAGRPIHWKPGANPPDVLCIDDGGHRIGVELVEWLNEEQMKASRIKEKVEKSFLEIIRSQELLPPSKIEIVQLSTKRLDLLTQADTEAFRKELLSLIAKVDSDWETLEGNLAQQGYFHSDFSSYPYLGKYLGGLHFWPRSQSAPSLGMRWIRFPYQGGAYSPQDAIEALRQQLNKKTGKYLDLHQQQNLDELYLLIYYDQAWFHNTPFSAPGFGFREIANIAAQFAANNPGVFQKIFLFNSLYGNQEAVQLWPG